LQARDLQRISDAFGLGWTSKNAMDQAILRRAAHAVSRAEIESVLTDELSGRLKTRKIEVFLPDRDLSLHLSSRLPATVAVEKVSVDADKGTFSAMLAAPDVNNPVVRKTVTGRFYELKSVPVLSSALTSGDVIDANDIVYAELRASTLPADAILNAEQIIGQTPRLRLTAGEAIQLKDIQKPTLVKKGDAVTMILETAGLSLTAQGRALQNGSAGDVVRIINTASNKVVEGIVDGAQSVRIAPSVKASM
jgi:flagella basal body P-ring formation protein FlgA